ncbi:class I SAM-dependent methyltransferase [Anaerosacchariphilus polymeriproducens]|uniref:Class I SAM-dependent methyltransferase n=1 Tax=Anaerosacchariphilus polymeriproducens TaxID=1812858 RepID=A0A371ARR2_9FIRM|nr:class I SAM-dependent methyltransferase [Anaerosacchariphilus polymeriproducens]RDU22244.1 class I SAM-dependent methyltransferase [Anaerosacchariphilus polymeriproducens]
MGTSWKETEITKKFNEYNDMLENILGFQTLFDQIQKDRSIKTILDYGCGPGKVSYRLAGIKEEYSVIAVDESEGMLNIAQNERAKENIHYQCIANDDLSFLEDSSIDCAIICFVFINNSNKERILKVAKEVFRVLKKNGTLFILDSNPEAIGYEFTTFQNGLKNFKYKDGDKKQQYLHIPGSDDLILDDYFWSREFYLSFLNKAGFKNITIFEPTIDALSEESRKEAEKIYNVKEWKDEKEQAPFIIFDAVKK